MNVTRFNHIFPFGSHLCREPMPPMSEMKHDMELLKKQGFNLIKLQENWMIDEPSDGRFENVVVWNTWQEIGYWGEWLVGQGVCFCPNTLASFRRWLGEQYGDLDALNRAWNSPAKAGLSPIGEGLYVGGTLIGIVLD